ncbi:hypothetical protein FHG71_13010 [Rubellimicrobium roseum]|uniref:Uncharacterized protein n=1 Tax=Rubellimicrobium roseum TaxID=687525 RepID=A0A5C4NAV6_9RHOB|nr:hypothetical protein FHG71_13010 [Rubellimicrobium roseum]
MLLPLVAMQVTGEVDWTLSDFVAAGVLLGGAGLLLELALRRTSGPAERAATGLALATGLLLAWVNGAVGLIGSEGNPANLLYGGVLAVGLLGALAARLRPRGMARAMVATALAQVLVPLVALGGGLGVTGPVSVGDVLMGTGLFAGLWLLSAWLFGAAARPGAAA